MSPTAPKHGFGSTLLNLFTCMCGLGVLAWPHNVGGSGVLVSALALALVLSGFWLSISILAQVTETAPKKTMQALVEAYFGRKNAVFMQAFYVCLGICVACNALVVVADSFSQVKYAEDLARGYVLLIACALLFVIALPKQLNALKGVSFFSLTALTAVYVTIAMDAADVGSAPANGTVEIALLPTAPGTVLAIFPIFVSSFTCHVNAVRAFDELDDVKSFPRIVALLGFLATAFYAVFTVTALWAYGADVPGDVVTALSGTKGTVAQITTGALQLLKTPFVVQPCRDMLFDISGVEETFPRRVAATAGMCAVCFAAAYPVKDLSQTLAILGGLAGATCTLGLPGGLAIAHARLLTAPAAAGAAEEGEAKPLVPAARDAAFSFSPGFLRAAGWCLVVAGAGFLVVSFVSLGVH